MDANPDATTPAPDGPMAHVVAQLSRTAERLRQDGRPPAEAVADATLELVDGARWCTITVHESGRFRSLVSSDPTAERLDQLQIATSTGPCLDAIRHRRSYVVTDLTTEDRWPEYAAAAASLGARSILARPLFLFDGERTVAGLNVYSDAVGAFGPDPTDDGTVAATFAALATSLALSQDRSRQLEQALQSNRQIAMALGILIGRHSIDHETALNLLRWESQKRNRRVADIAEEIVATGELSLD